MNSPSLTFNRPVSVHGHTFSHHCFQKFMSYDPRLAGQPYGAPGGDDEQGARKGSVRAARQRLQAAQMRTQLPDTSKIIGLPMSQYSIQQNRYDPSSQSRSLERRGNGSLASPPPQWPLSNDADDASFPPVPPLRSPRKIASHRSKSYVQYPTTIRYNSPLQNTHHPPFRSYSASRNLQITTWATGATTTLSPYSSRNSRPLTTSSGVSEASSLGSIPDFPCASTTNGPRPAGSDERQALDRRPPPGEDLRPTTLKCRTYHRSLKRRRHAVEYSSGHDMALSRPATSFPMNDDYYPDDIIHGR